MMKPYWTSPDGAIRVFHAPCEAVIASVLPVREVALVHADPPYGVREQTDRSGRLSKTSADKRCKTRIWPAIPGDDRPFDPAPLLALNRPTVLWGANHYSSRVPGSASWIVWDKRHGSTPDLNADAEIAWSNLGGPLRIFRHLWRAICRDSEAGDAPTHPTQKPIALSTYVFGRAKLKRGDLVFVPYLGSGPDLPAAQAMGLRVIACDVERWCCDTAISRLGAITADRAAEPCGPLFGAVEPVRK